MWNTRRGPPAMVSVESINEQAARWAIRTVAGPLSSEEHHDLEAWLNSNPRHRGAYVRCRARWADLDRLAALHGPPSAIREEIGPPQSAARNLMVEKRKDPARVSRRELLAAGIAAASVVGGGLSWRLLRGNSTRYVSGIGEIRRIALEDGSTLTLNTATEVAVEFSAQQRDIRLIRGEALFEVAHNSLRPFVVVANDTAVRAVGTAFAVRIESNQIAVTVTEGVVEVANSRPTGSVTAAPPVSDRRAKRVSANQRIVIASARAPEIRALTAGEADRQLAWRDGMVSFDGESLQEAVAEINRHNRRQIVVDDPDLAAKPIDGVFRATDVEGFAAAAAGALRAKAVSDGDVIRLEQGGSPTAN
jgi:transmembrane sensor